MDPKAVSGKRNDDMQQNSIFSLSLSSFSAVFRMHAHTEPSGRLEACKLNEWQYPGYINWKWLHEHCHADTHTHKPKILCRTWWRWDLKFFSLDFCCRICSIFSCIVSYGFFFIFAIVIDWYRPARSQKERYCATDGWILCVAAGMHPISGRRQKQSSRWTRTRRRRRGAMPLAAIITLYVVHILYLSALGPHIADPVDIVRKQLFDTIYSTVLLLFTRKRETWHT